MRNTILSAGLGIGLLAAMAGLSFANDGHGNAEQMNFRVPNTGSLSGGPSHRNDHRHGVQEAQAQKKDSHSEKGHSADDGHEHGNKRGGK